MCYNTENEATLQELPEKIPISAKKNRKFLLKIDKKESKKLKRFEKLLEQMSQGSQYNQSKYNQSSELYLKILVPYLDNPYEEAMAESSQTKEQHETIKILNEEVMLKST